MLVESVISDSDADHCQHPRIDMIVKPANNEYKDQQHECAWCQCKPRLECRIFQQFLSKLRQDERGAEKEHLRKCCSRAAENGSQREQSERPQIEPFPADERTEPAGHRYHDDFSDAVSGGHSGNR
jgi:hypothetical protein